MTFRFPALVPAVALTAAVAATPARAGLLPVGVTVAPEAGRFRWTYAVVLPTDTRLQPGNYFTIYDFPGFVPGSATAPAGWRFTAGDVGLTPPLVTPTDDPAVPNLSWTYDGSAAWDGQLGLGDFTALSDYPRETDSYFVARTNRTSDGKADTNITTTRVPVPTAVPEPASVLAAAGGLAAVAAARAARRNRG